ncbi:MAG: diguanylate cyclase, partial [Chloroflexi bacterium]|nr:diguanylate cyclase [Chloroflexota bacterium]
PWAQQGVDDNQVLSEPPTFLLFATHPFLYLAYNRARTFTPANRQLVQSLASHAAVAIDNAQMFDEITRAACTDSLTGLPNHRHLMDRLDEEIARARRSSHPLAVMMIDVDDFKLVNDAHGHTKGDDLLRLVARTLLDTFRQTDKLGRYGGDEFLALLPETDREEAALVAERLLSAMRAQQFCVPRRNTHRGKGASAQTADGHHSGGVAIPVRLSIGVAVYPLDSSNRLELISLADAAMYSSKRGGGNLATLVHSTDSGFLAAQNTTFSVLEGLVNAVDGKDRYTRVHSEYVAEFGLGLAQVLGLSPQSKRMIRIASLLHDVGKIGIPDRILRKPGELDDDERETIKQHPLLSEMIIREVPQLTDVLEAVRHHHERYDGTGYPRGLQGSEIPFLSRIISIADAYSAMILDRPYRKALSPVEAAEELRRNASTQFDPELVEAFIRSLALSPQSSALDSLPRTAG